MTTSRTALELLGSVDMVIELQDVTSTSREGPNGDPQELAARATLRTQSGRVMEDH